MDYYIDNRFLVLEGTLIQYTGSERVMNLPAKIGKRAVKVIGSGSLNSNTLRLLRVPEGVEEIHSLALNGCRNLEQIILPATLGVIQNNAIGCCQPLRSILFTSVAFERDQYDSLQTNSAAVGNKRRVSLNIPDVSLITAALSDGLLAPAYIPESFHCLFFQYEDNERPMENAYDWLSQQDGRKSRGTETEVIKWLITQNVSCYTHGETEEFNDLAIAENKKMVLKKHAVFCYDPDETVFAAGKAYVKGELKTGYIFWPSLVPVNDAGSTYYLYRRCYLNNEKRYRTVDVGIFDSRGCPVEEERAKEVYGKYTFMRVL